MLEQQEGQQIQQAEPQGQPPVKKGGAHVARSGKGLFAKKKAAKEEKSDPQKAPEEKPPKEKKKLSRKALIAIGAGAGDILAKHCCLTDWRVSSYLTGEPYGNEAADLMYEALHACEACLPELVAGRGEGVDRLMDALLVSGYAMVVAGNSRPASGAEHHMSHFLEMDFLRRGKPIPLHGVKVGLGTMVSLYLYRTLRDRPDFEGKELVLKEAEKLPSPERVRETLGAFGCPVRFSELDVPADTVRRMLFEAYKIRDRFTVLTLYCTRGFMDKAADEIMERFY